jgi:hypothetical protein
MPYSALRPRVWQPRIAPQRFLSAVEKEPKCLYYGFSVNGDEVFCREAYDGGEGVLEHVANVGPLLKSAMEMLTSRASKFMAWRRIGEAQGTAIRLQADLLYAPVRNAAMTAPVAMNMQRLTEEKEGYRLEARRADKIGTPPRRQSIRVGVFWNARLVGAAAKCGIGDENSKPADGTNVKKQLCTE